MSKATLLLKSNAIFDAISDEPKPGFVAVRENRIIGTGGPEEESSFIDPATKVLDMGDKLIMPGFHDSHVHLVMAGMYSLCANLSDAKSEAETCEILRDFVEKNPPEGEWIHGFSWYHFFWDDKTLPTKASLDKYFPDRPVFLLNAEAHGAWVNSKALEIAGVTKDTPDPFGGAFIRDENGEPTGFLYESAAGAVTKYALQFTPEEEKKYV